MNQTTDLATLIAQNGGVTGMALLVTLVLTQRLKPIWDEMISPAKALHDSAIQFTALVLALTTTLVLLWVLHSPNDRTTIVAFLFDTFLGWAGADWTYKATVQTANGGPVTPTTKVLSGIAALTEFLAGTGQGTQIPGTDPVPTPDAAPIPGPESS